jgi:hypothetical protein
MCSFTTAHHIVFEAGDSRFLRILVTALEPGYDGIISHVLETRKSLVIYYNPFLLHRAELKKLVRAVFHDTESHGLRIVETQDRTIRRRRG